MLELNTTGHGTIKKLRTGAVISTLAISALGISTSVSASETEVAVNEPATRVVAKDEVVPKVPTQADVDKAKAESDKASQDVAKQKEVVASTEANIATAKKTIADTTKKVEEAKSVTPEKVAEAKADADKKANELANVEKTVADADKSVSATAEKVADKTKVVSNAEKTATATANKVAEAQKKVDSLSTTTDTHELEKNEYTLSTKVAVDERAVEKAQKKLDEGKKAIADKEQAMKDTQKKVDSAESKLSQATTALANAKANQTAKEDAVNKAKSALEVAKQGVTVTTSESETFYNIPKATYAPALSQGYLDAIKALADGSGTSEAVDSAVYEVPYTDPNTGESADSLSDFNSTGSRTEKGQSIPYGAEDTDDTEIADFQHLTKDQQVKLSIYAASIINELRAKVGTKPLTVGDSSLKLAEAFNNYSNAYISANSGEYSEHNVKSNDEKFELAKEESGVENSLGIRSKMIPDFLGLDKKVTTMAHVKQIMYQGIVNALMGVNETTSGTDSYAAALSLLGLRDTDKTNIGVGIGYLGSYTTKGYEATITLSAPQDNVTTTQKVDEEAVEKAQNEYTEAYKAYKEAEDAAILANSRYNDAKDALYFARNDLSDIKMGNIDLEELETKLAEAKDKLAKDTEALQTAKEVLAIAKSNATDVATALKQAKEELKTAKSEKATADETLATAKGELEVLTKAHDLAVLARKSAGQDLARKREASKEASDTYEVLALSLTERDKVLKALETELTGVKSKLGVLSAELKTAKDELARLEGNAEAKARGYENFKQLKANHDAYLAEQQRLQALKDKEDAIRKAGGEVKPVLDATGKVVDVVDAKAKDKAVVATVGTKDDKTYQAPAQATNAKVEPKKQLPNTGTKETMLGLLGLGLLAGLGLGYTKKNLRK
jgi:surface exclusion protein prgA